MLDDMMGPGGSERSLYNVVPDTTYNTEPIDDPFAAMASKNLAQVMAAKFDDKIWEEDEPISEEFPELVKESGAIYCDIKGC